LAHRLDQRRETSLAPLEDERERAACHPIASPGISSAHRTDGRPFGPDRILRVSANDFPADIAALPKAELHLHLEGSLRPTVVVQLAARHGVQIQERDVRQRYRYSTFPEFLEAFKWVTAFLREPEDFAFLAADLAEQLLAQNVAYAEVTLSVGVMLVRGQNPQANFEAVLEATEPYEGRGLRLNWIFDAVRQFGPGPAVEVVEWAHRCASPRLVAFGIGGDELSVSSRQFQPAYRRAESYGFHRVIHAGETGGPGLVQEAVELLGAERIGHGIAAIHDPRLMDLLTERKTVLEVCPSSNVCTGALARQLGRPTARITEHPLPLLLRRGIPVVLSSDDPPMFHTSIGEEYQHAHEMGLSRAELEGLVANGFRYAFS